MKTGVLSLSAVLFLSSCSTTSRAPVISKSPGDSSKPAAVSNKTPSPVIAPTTGNQGYHVVEKDETLYSIAWRYGFDYRNLARWNNIPHPYVIYPKQVLRLKPLPVAARPTQAGTPADQKKQVSKPVEKTAPTVVNKSLPSAAIRWQWPTRGNLVNLNTPTSKKGIDIAGKPGQVISAAAAGEVVYSGSGLLGYGKLIIVKHNDTFLSAYAHNENIFVKEGDKVSAGDKIATMGIGNNGKPLLHFEIRQDGQPVSPLDHLPKQRS